ncbi:unnamed protein product [Adineta ricciae]|uniref:RBR-type E3 ubiquitin transferase n=1 Tax=Adineta ricciae TaxID=249248 RepID=A0A813VC04_ADIRI|nr:unnamed protein product [Adineta ricciae]
MFIQEDCLTKKKVLLSILSVSIALPTNRNEYASTVNTPRYRPTSVEDVETVRFSPWNFSERSFVLEERTVLPPIPRPKPASTRKTSIEPGIARYVERRRAFEARKNFIPAGQQQSMYSDPLLSPKSSDIYDVSTTSSIKPRILPLIQPKNVQTCTICLEKKSKTQFEIRHNKQCIHKQRTICDECLYQHVKISFQNLLITDYYCMEPDCRTVFDLQAIQKILKYARDRPILDRYNAFLRDRELEKQADFLWCAHGCGCGQIVIDGNEYNIITCRRCFKKTCFIHRTVWHENLTCKQYDEKIRTEEQETNQWIAQRTKKCPKCSVNIEKNQGCDHMTCIRCNFEFCWICLVDFQDIRRDGNHRHHSSCRHYFAFGQRHEQTNF